MKRSAMPPMYAEQNNFPLAAGKARLVLSRVKQTAFVIPAVLLCLAYAGYIHQTNAAAIFLLPAVVLCCTCTGYIYQIVATALDKRHYPPPGKLVSINGHRLHIQSDGRGSPTVILEAGLGAMSSGWGWIQPEVAKFTRVVSYDRAGLGWSEADNFSPSALHRAWQLHKLLQTSGIDGPYVLAGHSMGGLLVRVFANQYPDETVGIVLIDASHPDQYVRSPAIRRHMNSGFQLLKRMPLLTKLGYVRLTRVFHSQAEALPALQRAEAEAFLSSYNHFKTTLKESLAWHTVCAEVRCARNLGSMPLAVVSAGKNLLPGACELQAELAALSSDSMHLVVPGADHVTLVTHREHAQSVVEAIRHVVEKINKRHGAG
jgi:pimeloyl-ACP methyl ester carboxylesterase